MEEHFLFVHTWQKVGANHKLRQQLELFYSVALTLHHTKYGIRSIRIVGTLLPTLEDLHAARTKTRACKILSDPPHPGHRRLFRLLPSVKVLHLSTWLELRCGRHNLELNTLKTVEMIVDFRRHPSPQLPLTLSSCLVSTVETFKFLGITVSQVLKWAININSVLKKAQQRMYFLRLLRKHGLLSQFYTAVLPSKSGLVVLQKRTNSDCNGQSKLLGRLLVTPTQP
ncbi:uncharacterized protein LOC133482116 [Phyllopteryx taeniolatus]|uniref:uncharacterized protein LOC133482116 n=1 Tax=Phyllopteryx taeniolatus TaxID=161469 RepID=UPI002AD3F61F|nr:uncharacterized protein LOC133482116 [Phyllopteryx taeniolatus]XP_061637780.1 uncharacterized protein LOC133482116 [Phyllopteryx taeniolatus]